MDLIHNKADQKLTDLHIFTTSASKHRQKKKWLNHKQDPFFIFVHNNSLLPPNW